jgi:hypothetical protein
VALDILRKQGRLHETAECLVSMAQVQEQASQGEAARAGWAEALEILEELDHPDADLVRAKLEQDG